MAKIILECVKATESRLFFGLDPSILTTSHPADHFGAVHGIQISATPVLRQFRASAGGVSASIETNSLRYIRNEDIRDGYGIALIVEKMREELQMGSDHYC